MSFKDDMKQKINNVAEFMQMTDEIIGRANPVPVTIDGKLYALVLHPVEEQPAEAPTEAPAEDAPVEGEVTVEPAEQQTDVLEEFA